MIPYIIHSSILLSFSFLAYRILLRQETFFKMNRIFLVSALILSMGLPLLQMPQSLSFRKPIVVEVKEESVLTENFAPEVVLPIDEITSNDLSEEITSTTIIADQSGSKTSFISKFTTWSFGEVLWLIYLLGIAIFVITFLIQFFILLMKKSRLEYIQDGKFRIYELKEKSAPFSFMKWIFINPELYDFETYSNIIEHEKIHVSQAHYIDKLIAEFAVIAFWFNPFVWFHRNAINNNLEFLTDEAMIVKGTEKETYQMNLLKVCVPQHALTMTTSYNESFLSERIKMMNSKKSSAKSSWKYLLILPFIGFTLATLNAVRPSYVEATQNLSSKDKTFANHTTQDDTKKLKEQVKEKIAIQEKQKVEKKTSPQNIIDKIETNKSTQKVETNNNPPSNEKTLELKEADLSILILEEVAGAKKEFEKEDYKKQKYSQKKHDSCFDKPKTSNQLDQELNSGYKQILGESKNQDIKPGYWRGIAENDKACFFLNNSKSSLQQWTMNECFLLNEITDFSLGKNVAFYISRAAGTLYFEGSFDDKYEGVGKFRFEENNAFAKYLSGYGIEDINKEDLFLFFINKTGNDFVKFLSDEGYELNKKRLLEAGIFKIDKNKVNDFKQIFKDLGDEGNLRDMVNMQIHGVDKAFVDGLLQVNSDDLSIKRVTEAKIHDVDATYIKFIKSELGLEDISLNKIIEFKIHGLTKQSMKDFKTIGYADISPTNIVEFLVHGVTPDYIKKIRALGYKNISPRNLIEFKIHGVDGRYIKSLKDLGYNDLSERELIEGKIHGVSASYVQSLLDAGIKNINFRKAVEGRIHGVDSRFIQKGKEKGYSPEDMSGWIKLAIHGF